MHARWLRVVGILAVVAAAALGCGVAWRAARWVGAVFPGFLVLENRVVPSIALPDWQDGAAPLFQQEVLSVDGIPVGSGADVYAIVRRAPAHRRSAAGAEHVYRVRAPGGQPRTVTVRAREFGVGDFLLLFGTFLLNAGAFAAVGVIVLWLLPRSPTSHGFVAFSLCSAAFMLTACDLYGPYRLFRVHVVAESLLAATAVHLALVFPVDRLRRCRALGLAAVYAPFVLLAIVYEVVLHRPAAYTAVHLAATATHGLGAAVLVGMVAAGFVRSRSPLMRRRVGVVAVGLLAGLIVPGVLMAWSAVTGGRVPLNAGALTGFLFPVSLAYAIVKHDLFELDVVLRRAVTYVLVILALALTYLLTFWALNRVVPLDAGVPPLLLAAQNLAMLLLLAPLKVRIQAGVDRLFFRGGYDPERALSDLARELAAARDEAHVAQALRAVLARSVGAMHARLLLAHAGGWVDAERPASAVELPAEVGPRLAAGQLVTRWASDDGAAVDARGVWLSLDAELLVPVVNGGALGAVLVLGRKASGAPYRLLDSEFLAAASGQVALALTTAAAFGQLALLNADLEQQVRQRTAALEVANAEVHRSLAELRAAYAQLERSQASLLRADRLATLGRLAAGIAHEVNTPLGAMLAELKLLGDLADEYRDSVHDPGVTKADHAEIAAEMGRGVRTATEWARKASAYIRRMKLHGRDAGGGRTRFLLRDVVRDAEALLAHRLRAAACHVEVAEEPRGVALYGDPARLGQVVVNVIGNALDAYEDGGRPADRIAVEIRQAGTEVRLAIRDWAGGMPPDVAAHVFDELFTTKDAGRGTGLGLWISRTLVEETFGGTIAVEVEPGVGSCFVLELPVRGREDGEAPAAAGVPASLAAAG